MTKLQKRKTILVSILSLAFIFIASAAFANLNFGSTSISSDGTLNLNPTDQPVTINGEFSLSQDSIRSWIFNVSNLTQDFNYLSVTSGSDGYAGNGFLSSFIAQAGDVDPGLGTVLAGGERVSIGSMYIEMADTTNPDSVSAGLKLSSQDPAYTYAFLANSANDFAIGSVLSTPLQVSDANLFINGDGSGTIAKGVLTAPTIKTTPVLFSALPTCNGGFKGSYAYVTDSTTVVWGATATGGGANNAGLSCNGTNWTVFSK